jgi:hypothetical protein
MEVTKISQILILSISTMLVVGCSGKPEKKPSIVAKPMAVVQNSQASIADLKGAGFGTIGLKGKKLYSQNQTIRFSIDTNKKTGYLYIIYLDDKGETTLLYPNAQSPLTELNGKYIFPRDFGGMQITATKDCKGCQKERTTVYAVLSKEPISDIKGLKAKHLIQGKGLSMTLPGAPGKNSNINIGKIDFFVK